MLRNIFLKTLRDQRKSLMFWGLGVAALTLITVLFYPSIKDVPEFNELLNDSDALARVFAGGFTDITSPEGYLNSQLFALLVPILFLIFAIGLGSGYIAAEERSGTLDVLLSNPLKRSKVLVQKSAAMIVAIALLALVFWLSAVIGALLVQMEIGFGRVLAATVSGMLLGTAFGAFAMALGSATGKRGMAIGVTGAVAVGSYFIYALLPLVDSLEVGAKLSPFYYYIGADPLANGLSLMHAAVLVALTVGMLAVALFAFERRDLAV